MKILVTGGLGVIGSYIARTFAHQGHVVSIIDAAEKPRNDWIEASLKRTSPTVTVHKARMEKPEAAPLLEEAARRMDLVVHAAASTGIPHSADDPNDDWLSNVEATRALLEAYRRAKRAPSTIAFSSVKPYATRQLKKLCKIVGKRYVLASSSFIVDGIHEEVPLEPDEPYAASKMAQSALCLAYARSYDMPITILRFSNLYGPAPCHGPRHGWLTWFCISAAIGRPIEVQGDGLQTRDMLYAKDIHAAVTAAHANIDSTRGHIFNVGGGIPNTISVAEAADILKAETGVEITDGPGRKNEDHVFITDHGKFTRATKWQPTIGVQQGIAKVLSWARDNKEALKKLYEPV